MRPHRSMLSARAQVPEDLRRAAGDLRRMASEALEADPEDGRIRLDLVCSPELAWHFDGFTYAFGLTVMDLVDDAMCLESAAHKIANSYR